MDAKRFYSIPFDARNDMKMLMLRADDGGIVAFGRWQALLGMLYDEDGLLDLSNDTVFHIVENELELHGGKLEAFIEKCVEIGLLDAVSWDKKHVVSRGVLKEIEYKKTKETAGRRGGRPKKSK